MGDNRSRPELFGELTAFIGRIPAVSIISSKVEPDGQWWIKFGIAIDHKLAWNVVQELGSVLNYISQNERLPTVFMPVSPPPYLNGGPREFLSWVIETREPIEPMRIKDVLEGRLPRPVDDENAWKNEDQ